MSESLIQTAGTTSTTPKKKHSTTGFFLDSFEFDCGSSPENIDDSDVNVNFVIHDDLVDVSSPKNSKISETSYSYELHLSGDGENCNDLIAEEEEKKESPTLSLDYEDEDPSAPKRENGYVPESLSLYFREAEDKFLDIINDIDIPSSPKNQSRASSVNGDNIARPTDQDDKEEEDDDDEDMVSPPGYVQFCEEIKTISATFIDSPSQTKPPPLPDSDDDDFFFSPGTETKDLTNKEKYMTENYAQRFNTEYSAKKKALSPFHEENKINQALFAEGNDEEEEEEEEEEIESNNNSVMNSTSKSEDEIDFLPTAEEDLKLHETMEQALIATSTTTVSTSIETTKENGAIVDGSGQHSNAQNVPIDESNSDDSSMMDDLEELELFFPNRLSALDTDVVNTPSTKKISQNNNDSAAKRTVGTPARRNSFSSVGSAAKKTTVGRARSNSISSTGSASKRLAATPSRRNSISNVGSSAKKKATTTPSRNFSTPISNRNSKNNENDRSNRKVVYNNSTPAVKNVVPTGRSYAIPRATTRSRSMTREGRGSRDTMNGTSSNTFSSLKVKKTSALNPSTSRQTPTFDRNKASSNNIISKNTSRPTSADNARSQQKTTKTRMSLGSAGTTRPSTGHGERTGNRNKTKLEVLKSAKSRLSLDSWSHAMGGTKNNSGVKTVEKRPTTTSSSVSRTSVVRGTRSRSSSRPAAERIKSSATSDPSITSNNEAKVTQRKKTKLQMLNSAKSRVSLDSWSRAINDGKNDENRAIAKSQTISSPTSTSNLSNGNPSLVTDRTKAKTEMNSTVNALIQHSEKLGLISIENDSSLPINNSEHAQEITVAPDTAVIDPHEGATTVVPIDSNHSSSHGIIDSNQYSCLEKETEFRLTKNVMNDENECKHVEEYDENTLVMHNKSTKTLESSSENKIISENIIQVQAQDNSVRKKQPRKINSTFDASPSLKSIDKHKERLLAAKLKRHSIGGRYHDHSNSPTQNITGSTKRKNSRRASSPIVRKPFPSNGRNNCSVSSDHSETESRDHSNSRPRQSYTFTPRTRRLTTPKPFNLSSSRSRIKHSDSTPSNESSGRVELFKARPLPKSHTKSIGDSGLPRPERKELTTPVPFRLHTLHRSEYHHDQIMSTEDLSALECTKQFRARELPDLSFKPPQLPAHHSRGLTTPEPFRLHRPPSRKRQSIEDKDAIECVNQFRARPLPNMSPQTLQLSKNHEPKKLTVPTPFKLSENIKSKREPSNDEIELSKKFKARPVPDMSFKPETLGLSETREITVPTPFHLKTDERGSQEKHVMSTEELEAAKCSFDFHARPLPDLSFKPETLGKVEVRDLTVPTPFDLATEKRPSDSERIKQQNEDEIELSKKFKARPLPDMSFKPETLGKVETRELTIPEPFHLKTDERGSIEKPTFPSKEDIEAAECSFDFHARPMPDLSYKAETLGHSEIRELTVPTPFRLKTDERGSREKLMTPSTEELKAEECSFQFHARPMPDLSCRPPKLPKEYKPRELTVPTPFHLSTSSRYSDHSPSPTTEELEAQECAKNFRANPLPSSLHRPPKNPKHSTKPLTTTTPFKLRTERRHTRKELPVTPDDIELSKQFKARPYRTPSPSSRRATVNITQNSLTVPTPFRLQSDLRHEAYQREQQERKRKKILEDKLARNFKAEPAPRRSTRVFTPLPSRKKLTEPEPFNLRSVSLHEHSQMQLRSKIEKEDKEVRRRSTSFRASPLPRSTPISKKTSKKKPRKPLSGIEPNLRTKTQAEHRRSFDNKISQRMKSESARRKMIEKENYERSKSEIEELRRLSVEEGGMVHKAKPINHVFSSENLHRPTRTIVMKKLVSQLGTSGMR